MRRFSREQLAPLRGDAHPRDSRCSDARSLGADNVLRIAACRLARGEGRESCDSAVDTAWRAKIGREIGSLEVGMPRAMSACHEEGAVKISRCSPMEGAEPAGA